MAQYVRCLLSSYSRTQVKDGKDPVTPVLGAEDGMIPGVHQKTQKRSRRHMGSSVAFDVS